MSTHGTCTADIIIICLQNCIYVFAYFNYLFNVLPRFLELAQVKANQDDDSAIIQYQASTTVHVPYSG